MIMPAETLTSGLEEYLLRHERRTLLRFLTCGSVDDGKSTLIGRLLLESQGVYDDQLASATADSRNAGTQHGELDLALLVDGLAAEREQGITIDVAYRYFNTENRKFIIADTPGHEQYTRNMVTGASTADLAVILVDARKGLLTQTKRHSYLVSLLGIRSVVLAINKLDAVEYSENVATQIERDYREFAAQLGLLDVTCIPMSALRGDNVVNRSTNMPWYTGPTLLEHLNTVVVTAGSDEQPFRMPVQWVNRPDAGFRGYSGRVASGSIRPGDRLRIVPGSIETTVDRIVTMDGDLPVAQTGQSITITLSDDVDVSRGNVLTAVAEPPSVADAVVAHVVWMRETPMEPGGQYFVKSGTATAVATLSKPEYVVDVNTLEPHPADTFTFNDIGVCRVEFDRPIAFDPYSANRDMGAFIVIDRVTKATVAAGMIDHADTIDTPPVAGAGASISLEVLRHGLNSDLGDSEADRLEAVRRLTEVVRLLESFGISTRTEPQ